MTSSDYACQIADALLLARLDPAMLCQSGAATFNLNVDQLVGLYQAALEREHPGISQHMARFSPQLTALLIPERI